jgi:hypothetical protein
VHGFDDAEAVPDIPLRNHRPIGVIFVLRFDDAEAVADIAPRNGGNQDFLAWAHEKNLACSLLKPRTML